MNYVIFFIEKHCFNLFERFCMDKVIILIIIEVVAAMHRTNDHTEQ